MGGWVLAPHRAAQLCKTNPRRHATYTLVAAYMGDILTRREPGDTARDARRRGCLPSEETT